MSMRVIVLLVAALALTQPAVLFAQEETPVVPGAKVRVVAPSVVDKRIVGFVEQLERDTLVLDAEGLADPLALPLVSVTSLEVRTGKKSKAGLGAAIGFGVGLVWTVVFLTTESICSPETQCGVDTVALSIGIYGGIGAALGFITGSFIKVDRWEAVPLDNIQLGLTLNGIYGPTLMASVRF